MPVLVAVTLLAMLLLPMSLVWATATRPWPRTDGSTQVSELGKVSVYRDR